MPKISVMTGLTTKIPGQDYGMLKVEIRYTDIDTEGDIGAQLEECDKVALAAAERSEKTLAQVASDASGLAVEGVGIAPEFIAFRDQAKTAITQLAREVKRQKDVLESLAGEKPAQDIHTRLTGEPAPTLINPADEPPLMGPVDEQEREDNDMREPVLDPQAPADAAEIPAVATDSKPSQTIHDPAAPLKAPGEVESDVPAPRRSLRRRLEGEVEPQD